MTAHLYHPIQDASGDLVLTSTVRVLDPVSLEPIPETLYTDRDRSNSVAQPFQVTNGVVDFYLAKPRVVTIETNIGGTLHFFPDLPVGFPHWETFTFTLAGQVGVSSGVMRFYVEEAVHIETVRASVGLPPEGQPLIVDVNVDGTTVFTDPDTRPSIAPTEYTAVMTPDVTLVPAGSYLTIDVDQVGTDFAGGQLVVQIRVGRA